MIGYDVLKVKCFTAKVHTLGDRDRPKRQQVYLRALREFRPGKIEIVKGHFLMRPKYFRMAYRIDPQTLPTVFQKKNSLPHVVYRGRRYWFCASESNVEVIKPEEKGTDVNLATHLLNDAWMDLYDAALIISNDSDLIEAVGIVKNQRGKEIVLANPFLWSRKGTAMGFRSLKIQTRKIQERLLASCQLPSSIPGTNIQKPASW